MLDYRMEFLKYGFVKSLEDALITCLFGLFVSVNELTEGSSVI